MSLAFLSSEFAIFPEFIRQIQLLLVLVPGLRLVFVFILGIGSGSRRSLISFSVGIWVWLTCFVAFLVGLQDCWCFSGNLGSTFPVTLIYLLYEIPKVVQILGLVEMNQLILDSLWKSEICFPMEHLVVIVKESGNPVEVYKELGGLVIVFHDQLFEFNFGIGDLVVQTEVNHEFFYEFIIVVKPGRFLIRVIRQVRLEVIESRSFQE